MVELFENINVDIFETAFPKPSIKELNDSIDLLLTKNKDNLQAFFRQQYPEIYSNYTSFFKDYNINFNKFIKSSEDKEIMGTINKNYKEIIKDLSIIPITKLFGEIYSEDALKDDEITKDLKINEATNTALKVKQAILNATKKKSPVESPQVVGGKRRTRKNKNKKTKYKNCI